MRPQTPNAQPPPRATRHAIPCTLLFRALGLTLAVVFSVGVILAAFVHHVAEHDGKLWFHAAVLQSQECLPDEERTEVCP